MRCRRAGAQLQGPAASPQPFLLPSPAQSSFLTDLGIISSPPAPATVTSGALPHCIGAPLPLPRLLDDQTLQDSRFLVPPFRLLWEACSEPHSSGGLPWAEGGFDDPVPCFLHRLFRELLLPAVEHLGPGHLPPSMTWHTVGILYMITKVGEAGRKRRNRQPLGDREG